MRPTQRKKIRLSDEENVEVDFSPLEDVFARSVRRPVEPGVWRSLVIAAVVGAGMGLFLWYFKPSPRAADAAPVFAPKMMNVESTPSTPSAPAKPDLFQLPTWDEAAYERDQAKR